MTKSASKSNSPAWEQVVSVARCDRWSIYYRLQDLNIPCACPADGTLRVQVDHPTALVLVRSTLRQFSAPRQDALQWLERCWETPVLCSVDH